MKKLFRLYQNAGIRTKLSLCVILAAVIPAILITAIFSGKLYSMVIADTIKKQQMSSSQVAPQVTEALEQITKAAELMRQEPYYQTLFYSAVNESYQTLAQTKEADAFRNRVKEIIQLTPVTAVRIYVNLPQDEEGFFEADASENIFIPEIRSRGTYWHGIFTSDQVSMLYCPRLYLSEEEINHYGDCAYVLRTSTTTGEHTYPAYVALYYSSDIYAQIMEEGIAVKDSVSYIVNERNATIASTDSKLTGMYYQYYEDLQDYLMSSNSFVEKSIAGKKVYLAINYMKKQNWFMVTVMPEKSMVSIANNTAFAFAAIYIVSILVGVILALLQTRSITTRLSRLNSRMRGIREELPKPLAEPKVHDEVGELVLAYNYMIGEMERMAEEQKQTAEILKMSEFNALQAQINPHFLYNMMDVINWMVLQGKPEEASNTIQQLARFYKLTLSKKKNISRIKQELEHVSIYIELQNKRFSDRIDFVLDIPDELGNYQIPKLTLQPIVENSILHGIMEKEDKQGTIVITGWEENGDVYLLVSDDGIGIPKEVLPHILSPEQKRQSRGTNIAVYNIHNRLQLLYGEKYGLSYESVYGTGCEVTIRIPCMKGEEKDDSK